MSESETDGRLKCREWDKSVKGDTDTLSAMPVLLISVVFNFTVKNCVRTRLRELMPKTPRQRQWKCERSSAARNFGTRREKEEINMIKKVACMHTCIEMITNNKIGSDEGTWSRC